MDFVCQLFYKYSSMRSISKLLTSSRHDSESKRITEDKDGVRSSWWAKWDGVGHDDTVNGVLVLSLGSTKYIYIYMAVKRILSNEG